MRLSVLALGLFLSTCSSASVGEIYQQVDDIVSHLTSQVGDHEIAGSQALEELPESFMDTVFGHLVNTPEVVAVKQSKLQAGELTSAKDLQFQVLSSKQEFDYDKLPNTYSDNFYALSSKLLKAQRVQYPDDDDVEDINTGIAQFGGIVTFAHTPLVNCFDPALSQKFDIAVVGAPFDTGTSFRPGARFGPNSIRQGSMRLSRGWSSVRGRKGTKLRDLDAFNAGLRIVDCGDIPMTPFDNRVALNQLYRGQRIIHKHSVLNSTHYEAPRIITLGGDHTITLLNIRSAYENFGKVTVVHFDSHIDTWDPNVLGGSVSHYAAMNHGTFLHYAAEAGFINNETSTHVGIRAPYIYKTDVSHDEECGFRMITARDIDEYGIDGIADMIKLNVGDTPVYLTLDIDVLDPAVAPGTGTVEPGGFTSREVLSILDALEGVKIVGADVVEVSPPYDTNSEITSLIAVHVVDSIIGLMVVEEV